MGGRLDRTGGGPTSNNALSDAATSQPPIATCRRTARCTRASPSRDHGQAFTAADPRQSREPTDSQGREKSSTRPVVTERTIPSSDHEKRTARKPTAVRTQAFIVTQVRNSAESRPSNFFCFCLSSNEPTQPSHTERSLYSLPAVRSHGQKHRMAPIASKHRINSRPWISAALPALGSCATNHWTVDPTPPPTHRS